MRALLILLVLAGLAFAQAQDFRIEKVDVTISDIKDDGSAKVHESIKFLLYGDYSHSVYDSGIAENDLSYWSTITKLKDVKMHVNVKSVDVQNFRLRPQPRTRCNPIQGVCHGEIILDYTAYPNYNSTTGGIIAGTGLFSINKYKPRTSRFTINPAALAFTTTTDGNIILEDEVYLNVKMPRSSMVQDINPMPEDADISLPASVDSLSWSDIVLVKFSLVFDVEDSVDKEVTDFFSNIIKATSEALSGVHGVALVALATILIGSYLYIIMAKRRGGE